MPGAEGSSDDAEAPVASTFHGILSNAFKRLQEKVGIRRTQSLPEDEPATHAAGAAAKGPLDKVGAAVGCVAYRWS